MIVLGLSTSTPTGSAALWGPKGLLAEERYDALELHAEQLLVGVDALVRRAGLQPRDIGAVACDVGPGSFTGIRVAVAAAEGIAAGLGVPRFGVTSLEALAAAAGASVAAEATGPRPVLALLDAKKSEVYVGAFEPPEGTGPFEHIDLGEATLRVERCLARGGLAVGDVVHALLGPELPAGASYLRPDAAWIARLGWLRLLSGASPQPLVPVYVRPPDAKPAFGPGGSRETPR
jgi:tRNA threonylcarbamoyladenosine biosynthesis protein TsaB